MALEPPPDGEVDSGERAAARSRAAQDRFDKALAVIGLALALVVPAALVDATRGPVVIAATCAAMFASIGLVLMSAAEVVLVDWQRRRLRSSPP